jgi:hypothetical protein
VLQAFGSFICGVGAVHLNFVFVVWPTKSILQTYLSWNFILNMKTLGSFVIVCLQVSLSLPWACLTWWALLMLMPTDMSALCVENVISHAPSWTGMFDMNVVEPGTSYSAGCVDEGFPDQTISDNTVTCTHWRHFNVHDYCVCWKSVIIAVLIWCDLGFVRNDSL